MSQQPDPPAVPGPEVPRPPVRVEVRAARPDDDPGQLRALRLEMLADTPLAFIEHLADAQRHPPGYWADRLRRYTADPHRCLRIAVVDGAWVAQAGGYLDGAGSAHLVSVYVTPRLRGRGLLEALAGRVFDWARQRRCPDIRLEVARENARAVAAYGRLGFRPTGHSQPHPLFPDASVEIEMRLPL